MKSKPQPISLAEIEEMLSGPDFDQNHERVAARFNAAVMKMLTAPSPSAPNKRKATPEKKA